MLVHWKLLPVPLLYLSAYLERERNAYYDRLNAVSDHAAWAEWLVFFLRGVASSHGMRRRAPGASRIYRRGGARP